MRINKKDQQIEKCEKIDFDECSKITFLIMPPYEKGKKSKILKNWFYGYPKLFLVRPLFT